MPTISLSGNYGYTTYTASNLASGTVIDATSATWIVSNSRNQNPDAYLTWDMGSDELNTYPFKITGAAAGLLIKGGAIWGEVPQTSDWLYTYNNSAAIRVENTPGVILDDWRIDKAWDAIRIAGGATDFLIDDAYITNARDDAVENDHALGGTIRDSLFDGVFSGISMDGSYSGVGNVVTLEGAFIHMKAYLYKGMFTHVSPFKVNASTPETTPDIRIINSVFAVEVPDHHNQGNLKIAWDHVIESRGNVFLNLSDTPLPSDYPLPASGFTILQGQEARAYWEAVKAAWHDNHDGTPLAAITPLPPISGALPSTVEPTAAPSSVSSLTGTSGSETLTGSAGVDQINGFGGSDKIFGKAGIDILTGGSGEDKFIFDTAMGSGNIDTITDFDTRYDSIYLDNAVFTNLGSGSLNSPKRLSNSWFDDRADDANDYILYDKATGILSYDADGNGAGGASPIAQLSPGTNLAASDIFIV